MIWASCHYRPSQGLASDSSLKEGFFSCFQRELQWQLKSVQWRSYQHRKCKCGCPTSEGQAACALGNSNSPLDASNGEVNFLSKSTEIRLACGKQLVQLCCSNRTWTALFITTRLKHGKLGEMNLLGKQVRKVWLISLFVKCASDSSTNYISAEIYIASS